MPIHSQVDDGPDWNQTASHGPLSRDISTTAMRLDGQADGGDGLLSLGKGITRQIRDLDRIGREAYVNPESTGRGGHPR